MVLISVRLSRPQGQIAAGRTKSMKNSLHQSVVESATLGLVAQCLNQLRHRMLRIHHKYALPLSYRVPVRERYGSTLLPATREQHDQNCT